MLRAGLLWLSEQSRIFRFIRGNGLARRFAARFVAGETVDSGVAALKDLNAAGLTASLDLLGESVHNAAEAQAARATYLETLDPIETTGADANGSAQRTQLGLPRQTRRGCHLRALHGAAPPEGQLPRHRDPRCAHHRAHQGVRARQGHPARALRVPDVVWGAARPAARAAAPGIQRARVRPVRH